VTGFGAERRKLRLTGDPVRDGFMANLWRARRRSGLSQEDLGFRAGLHRTEISLLEVGGRLPRIDTLVKLAGALEIEPGELLEGIAWNPGSVAVGGFDITPAGPQENADV
jgi:ribosome-binding protein aMBF1 (putative translation factor)